MPLFWISLAFLCGIILSPGLMVSVTVWLVIACSRDASPPAHLPMDIIPPTFSPPLNPQAHSPAIYPLLIVFFCLGDPHQIALPRMMSYIACYNDQPGEYH
jgi:hypothetical protein